MKISSFVILCTILFSSLLSVFAEPDKTILEIKKWYGQVEADKTLKETTFKSSEEELPHSLKITRYINAKGNLQKLHVVIGGEHGEARTTYYFREGKLFFVFEGTNEWRFTGKELEDGQTEVIDIAAEYRFYFSKGKCVKALEKRVELIGGDELNTLLKEKPNKEIKVVMAIHDYHKSAKRYSAIKSQEDLNKYINPE